MDEAFALLAPADPSAIKAFDYAGTRLDDLHSVVLHVVIRLKIRANLDAPGGRIHSVVATPAVSDVDESNLPSACAGRSQPRV